MRPPKILIPSHFACERLSASSNQIEQSMIARLSMKLIINPRKINPEKKRSEIGVNVMLWIMPDAKINTNTEKGTTNMRFPIVLFASISKKRKLGSLIGLKKKMSIFPFCTLSIHLSSKCVAVSLSTRMVAR